MPNTILNQKPEYFRAFPEYEEVFYDDIENHKKYFLPICSVNLKCIDPNRDEWMHFVTTKEVYDDQLARLTIDYHTKYSELDMFGFDIIDGKYKFEADWNYFHLNLENKIQENKPYFEEFKKRDFDDYEELFAWLNEQSCSQGLKSELERLGKAKIGKEKGWDDKPVYPTFLKYVEKTFVSPEFFKELRQVYAKNTQVYESAKQEFLTNGTTKEEAFFGFIKDLKFQSVDWQDSLEECYESIEEMEKNYLLDLIRFPKDDDDKAFEYIGCVTSYLFQEYGADELILFHNSELNKAVMCLSYS